MAARFRTTCKVCGSAKTIPKVMQQGVSKLEYQRDPYCSATCCRIDHGVVKSNAPTST